MADPFTVGALCTRILSVARRDMSVTEAARLMRESHVGTVLVVEETAAGTALAGILTDRDIVVSAVALEIDVRTLLVEDLMSADVATLREEDSLGAAIELMAERGVRRVAVLSADGTLVGLLSFDDLVAALALQAQTMTQALVAGRQREAAEHA